MSRSFKELRREASENSSIRLMIEEAKDSLPSGWSTSIHARQMLEDLLVCGASANTKEGYVDPTTIVLVMDNTGRVPEPPGHAYQQIINGNIVAELTTDELEYIKLPQGITYACSPVELIMTAKELVLKTLGAR